MDGSAALLPDNIFSLPKLQEELDQGQQPIAPYKQAIEDVCRYLDSEFRAERNIRELIKLRAVFIDQLLSCIWRQYNWSESDACLVAVGGYGRGELHPHSDIDLLILISDSDKVSTGNIEQFIALLWDIKLDIGHSVRTVSECVEEAVKDITVTTSLMESRPLEGSTKLHQELKLRTAPDKIWSSSAFFSAKREEQIQRHRKFANTEYNLEPNVKSSPGGLRDTQMIVWFALRHFGVSDVHTLANMGFLQAEEIEILENGQSFMWRVRYALHMIAGREEDRLLFDHQRELAGIFGYQDSDIRLAVEQFMQQYYRWALALSQLNEVLMQYFDEAIIRACEPEQILELNARFRVRNGYIEVCNDKVFERDPGALLEVFLLMSQHQYIDGVRASTIRLIRENRDRINDQFRADPRNQKTFMDLLCAQHKVALQLRRMNRYGILGQYLPEFGNIIGQMQHDLFHIYTVDAHILEVVKNMRRFQYQDMREKFPVAARIVKRLAKLELLYIAGLYHDIAKGCGGDHSILGSENARNFCENHSISKRDTNLVCWLVENHLIMSSVAQRKDISNPDVIQEFALQVGDQTHLDYLFALTVADINATNPTLWNTWRASLMRQLYAETKRALRRGLENPVDKQDWIEETQQQAIEQLEDLGFTEIEVKGLWRYLGDEYFLHERAEDVVWHTEAIAQHADKRRPLVLLKESSEIEFEGATQIFIYTEVFNYLFSVITAALEQLNLSVQDARLYSSGHNMTLDTFFVLDADGQSIGEDGERINYIKQVILDHIQDATQYPEIVQRRTPRNIKALSTPTSTRMATDPTKKVTVLEIATPDRPGLLARVGKIFFDFDLKLQAAKITTLGERVEDIFFITDQNNAPIEDPEFCESIQAAIRTELDIQASH